MASHDVMAYIADDIDILNATNALVFQQLMMQQGHLEDRVAMEGNSGVIKVRKAGQGSRPYYSGAYTDAHSFIGMHNVPNHVNTAGVGAVQVRGHACAQTHRELWDIYKAVNS